MRDVCKEIKKSVHNAAWCWWDIEAHPRDVVDVPREQVWVPVYAAVTTNVRNTIMASVQERMNKEAKR